MILGMPNRDAFELFHKPCFETTRPPGGAGPFRGISGRNSVVAEDADAAERRAAFRGKKGKGIGVGENRIGEGMLDTRFPRNGPPRPGTFISLKSIRIVQGPIDFIQGAARRPGTPIPYEHPAE